MSNLLLEALARAVIAKEIGAVAVLADALKEQGLISEDAADSAALRWAEETALERIPGRNIIHVVVHDSMGGPNG